MYNCTYYLLLVAFFIYLDPAAVSSKKKVIKLFHFISYLSQTASKRKVEQEEEDDTEDVSSQFLIFYVGTGDEKKVTLFVDCKDSDGTEDEAQDEVCGCVHSAVSCVHLFLFVSLGRRFWQKEKGCQEETRSEAEGMHCTLT